MVQEKLKQLNPGKTPGPDGWHPVLLIGIADVISLPLSIRFQKSLNEGILPPPPPPPIVESLHHSDS